jgi:hypothetical protein
MDIAATLQLMSFPGSRGRCRLDCTVVQQVEAAKILHDFWDHSITSLVCRQGNHVTIQEHCQSYFADNPRSATNSATDAMLDTPVPD